MKLVEELRAILDEPIDEGFDGMVCLEQVALGRLVGNTPSKVRKRGDSVRVSRVNAKIVKSESGSYKEVKANARATTIPRQVIFRLYGTRNGQGQMRDVSKAWVHCSCPYFQYTNEVALTRKKSSDILDSNGAAPKKTNPRMKAYLCKHLVAAAPLALKVTTVKKKG